MEVFAIIIITIIIIVVTIIMTFQNQETSYKILCQYQLLL